MSDSIAIIAKLTAVEGRRDDVVEVMRSMVEAVNAEAGTTVYALHVQADDDVTIWFYERYTDDAALVAHGTSDAMKASGPRLKGLLAGRPEIIRLSPVAAKGV
jgi:quinol monooxygenase YgiN